MATLLPRALAIACTAFFFKAAWAEDPGSSAPVSSPTVIPSWHGELQLMTPGTYHPASADVSLSAVVGASYYVQALTDDPALPLPLLGFFQHPDTISISVSGLNGTGVTASSTVWPWRQTGFSLAAGVSTDDSGAVTGSLTVGLSHFTGRAWRIDFQYVGSREHFGNDAGAFPVRSAESNVDKGRIVVTGVTAANEISVVLTGEAGESNGRGASIASLGAPIGADKYTGFVYLGSARLTGYLRRDLAISLDGAVHGERRSTEQLGGQASLTHTLLASAGAQIQAYPADPVQLRASYEAAFGGGPGYLSHTVTLGMAARF